MNIVYGTMIKTCEVYPGLCMMCKSHTHVYHTVFIIKKKDETKTKTKSKTNKKTERVSLYHERIC